MRLMSLALLGAALAVPAAGDAFARLSPDERLQEAIGGRIAAPPVDCIDLDRVGSMYVIDRTAIVYEAGRTIYVNRPTAGEKSLDSWDTLVTETHGGQLCSRDAVKLFDKAGGMQSGFVRLGKFIPYRAAEKTAP